MGNGKRALCSCFACYLHTMSMFVVGTTPYPAIHLGIYMATGKTILANFVFMAIHQLMIYWMELNYYCQQISRRHGQSVASAHTHTYTNVWCSFVWLRLLNRGAQTVLSLHSQLRIAHALCLLTTDWHQICGIDVWRLPFTIQVHSFSDTINFCD